MMLFSLVMNINLFWLSILQQEKAKEDTLGSLGKNEKHIIYLFLINKLLWTLIKQYIDISKSF